MQESEEYQSQCRHSNASPADYQCNDFPIEVEFPTVFTHFVNIQFFLQGSSIFNGLFLRDNCLFVYDGGSTEFIPSRVDMLSNS